MTKVYGTGMYEFRRHRVAEYPVGAKPTLPTSTAVSDRQPEAKPGSTLPNSITLIEIQKDRLTKVATDNWSIGADSDSEKSRVG
ncbi:hypothetical protein LIER_37056 [Lithospermum erythrorhizon]|uniref:Uncharacterized protein n=1 Tax=Lithospermum erythrorhizon TaxID=34254 RepID=A0AAV3PGE6_LITER